MTGTTPVPDEVEDDGLDVQLDFRLFPEPMEPRSQVTREIIKMDKEGGHGTL
jgi:hypothetical protein